eukprot:660441-Hanusia_phi.AAC.1
MSFPIRIVFNHLERAPLIMPTKRQHSRENASDALVPCCSLAPCSCYLPICHHPTVLSHPPPAIVDLLSLCLPFPINSITAVVVPCSFSHILFTTLVISFGFLDFISSKSLSRTVTCPPSLFHRSGIPSLAFPLNSSLSRYPPPCSFIVASICPQPSSSFVMSISMLQNVARLLFSSLRPGMLHR